MNIYIDLPSKATAYLDQIQRFLRKPCAESEGSVDEALGWLHDMLFVIFQATGKWDEFKLCRRNFRKAISDGIATRIVPIHALDESIKLLSTDASNELKFVFTKLSNAIRAELSKPTDLSLGDTDKRWLLTSEEWAAYLFMGAMATARTQDIMTIQSSFSAHIPHGQDDSLDNIHHNQLRMSVFATIFNPVPLTFAPKNMLISEQDEQHDKQVRFILKVRLRELAAQNALDSIAEISKHSSLSVGTIHGIWKGTVLPRTKTRRKLAESFGLPSDEFTTRKLIDWSNINSKIVATYLAGSNLIQV